MALNVLKGHATYCASSSAARFVAIAGCIIALSGCGSADTADTDHLDPTVANGSLPSCLEAPSGCSGADTADTDHLGPAASTGSLPMATRSRACGAVANAEVLRLFVSSTGADPPMDYSVIVSNINDLPSTLASLKLQGNYRRFEVEFSGGIHALVVPLVLNGSTHAPECGIGLRAQPDTFPVIKPAGELKGWSVHRGDIVKARIPAGVKVTGLSFDGRLLLRSRFPQRDINTPVGTILNLNERTQTFHLANHESTQRLQRAFSVSPDEGDPQIWIPGTGSIYAFDMVRVRPSQRGLVAIASKDIQHTVAFKCMQFRAQDILSQEERAACRRDPGNPNLIHKEVWRGIKPHHPFFLENHVEFISAPGEWAFDAPTQTLFMRIPDGVTLQHLNAHGVNFVNDVDLATRLQNLLRVEHVRDFSMEGLRFEGAAFVNQQPIFAMARGAVSTAHLVWNDVEGAFEKVNLRSAVEIRNTANIRMRRNEFTALDGVAVTVSGGSNHTIESNLFRDVGFSSLQMLGVSNVVVRDNIFRNIGARGVGDALRISGSQIHVTHNDIRNSSRGGIQVAGGWCGEHQALCDIEIRNNLLQDVITGGLTDYGAIYVNSISHQPVPAAWRNNEVHAKVVGNLIRRVRIAGFYPPQFVIEGPTGVYLDSGSKKVLVSRNELIRVHNGLNQNCSDANRFATNRITDSVSMLKSFERYGSIAKWVKKCVDVDPQWAALEGTTTVVNNGDSTQGLIADVGLTPEERRFWRARGVHDLTNGGD